MTRRNLSAPQRETSTAPTTSTDTDGLEERVLAFAEQLGRIVGTVQAKAAGWMDRDTLKKELPRVRDGAAELLQQLTGDAPPPVAVSTRTGGQRREESEDAAAASSTRPGRNIVRPCRPIPGRTVRTVRRPKCATRKPWLRRPVGAGAASLRPGTVQRSRVIPNSTARKPQCTYSLRSGRGSLRPAWRPTDDLGRRIGSALH
jgi:hypothetical protein